MDNRSVLDNLARQIADARANLADLVEVAAASLGAGDEELTQNRIVEQQSTLDRLEAELQKAQAASSQSDEVDEAGSESFPASDPPAWSGHGRPHGGA